MVFQKKNTSEKKDQNWFLFAMGLSHHLFSDYVSLKLMTQMETLAFAQTNLVGMVEVVEKSFKLFLAMHEKLENSLSHYSAEYGHNLEKLRLKAAEFDAIFEEEDIKQFTKPFGDKRGALYQHLRYGSEKSIEGFKTNLGVLMPIVEKIFFSSILRLDEQGKKQINSSSLLRFLIVNNEFHQSNNRDILIQAVINDNPYFNEYAEYSWDIENENKNILEAINRQETNREARGL
jgi:hypothetical protein